MSNTTSQKGDNIGDVLFRYLSYWPYYLIGVTLALILAHIYLRYQTPTYGVSSMIVLKDDNESSSEKTAFKDLKLISDGTNNIEDEIEILKSRSIIRKIIAENELNKLYFVEGRTGFLRSEFYKNSPIEIECNEIQNHCLFEVKLINNQSFKTSIDKYAKTHPFNSTFKIGQTNFIIKKTSFLNEHLNKTIEVSLVPVDNLLGSYIGRLTTKASRRSSIVQLEFVDNLEKRAMDFVNELVTQYNIRSNNNKNETSNNTKEFIDRRLELISQELNEVDFDVASFKQNNNIVDLAANTAIDLGNANEFEKVLKNIETEMLIVNDISKELKSFKKNQLIPEILPDDVSKSEINKFNEIILKRNQLLETANENHPVVLQLDNTISE